MDHAEKKLQQHDNGIEITQRNVLVFMGNRHDAFPRALLTDPQLEPVDIVCWQIIRISMDDALAAFPDYEYLKTHLRVSDGTVARSIAMLRLTRWMTFCRPLRDSRGRFRGGIYALHDEPISVEDAITLDEQYSQFVIEKMSHTVNAVKNVAMSVATQLKDYMASLISNEKQNELFLPNSYSNSKTNSQIETLFEDRLKRDSQFSPPLRLHSESYICRELESTNIRARSNSESHLQKLQSAKLENELKTAPPLQKSTMDRNQPQIVQLTGKDPLQLLEAGSSIYNNKNINNKYYMDAKTEERATQTETFDANEIPRISSFSWPREFDKLNDNSRQMLLMSVQKLNTEVIQQVLDEVAGIIRSKPQRQHKPVHLINALLQRASEGAFNFTLLGEAVARERMKPAANTATHRWQRLGLPDEKICNQFDYEWQMQKLVGDMKYDDFLMDFKKRISFSSIAAKKVQ